MDKIDTSVVKADIGYMYKRVNEQMQRGIRVKKQEKYVEYLTELASDLATKAKMAYGIKNIASTAQVAAYLNESSKKYKLGAKNDVIDCCYDSEEGKFKTDAKSLGRLAELGYEFAKDVLEYRTVQSYLRAFKWADGFEDMNCMVRPNISLTLTNRITYSKPNLIGIRKDVTWNTVAPLTDNDVMYSIDIKNEEPTILLNLVGDEELLEGLKSEEGLYNTMFKKVFEPKTVATVILDRSVPSHKMTHKEIMSDPRILGLPSKYSTGCHSIFYEGKEVLAVENIFFSYDGGHSSLPSTVGIELVDGVVDIPVQWDMANAKVDTNGSTVEGRLIGLEINIRKSDRDEFKRSWLSYTYGASMNSIKFGCKYIDGARVADYLGHIKSINKYKSLVKKAVKDGANSATTVFGNQLAVNEFDEGKRIRTMMNAPIQGTGADILAISIKRLDDEIARRGWGNVMQMYYTRHDEIVVNVNKEFADAHDEEIKDMLRDVVAFQIVHNGVEWTPLKVEISRIIPQPIHINIEDAGDEEE